MPRILVVNADDLGLTIGVNNGIFDAHDRGILTSASLFAHAPETPDAIRRARSRPSLGIGAHLALVDGRSVLPPGRVPSLVDETGRFRASWRPFIAACLIGRVALDEVDLELSAQVERLRDAGVQLTHLDAHKHVHAFPPIFAIVARLAERFGIPVVRVPYERWSPVGGDNKQQRRVARQQALLNASMLLWARRDYRIASASGLRTPQFVGRSHTGVLSAHSLEALLARLRPGVSELMVHPGYVDAALVRTGSRLVSSRVEEVRLLSAGRTRDFIFRERIQLARHDLVDSTRSFLHAS